jgi:hypothetical protein
MSRGPEGNESQTGKSNSAPKSRINAAARQMTNGEYVLHIG